MKITINHMIPTKPSQIQYGGFQSMGVPPVIIHLYVRILHELNHPAIGVLHLWKLPYIIAI